MCKQRDLLDSTVLRRKWNKGRWLKQILRYLCQHSCSRADLMKQNRFLLFKFKYI